MLTAFAGIWRIYVAADGRHLKGRDQGAPAGWEEIAATLADFSVSSVSLEGLQRRVRVAVDRAAEVYNDVQAVTRTLDDEFHVPEVSLTSRTRDRDAEISTSFTKRLAVATSPVPASEMFLIASRLLTHRSPITPNELNRLLPTEFRGTMPDGWTART
jgi:hypothetical protein